jgi:hypothetical protein
MRLRWSSGQVARARGAAQAAGAVIGMVASVSAVVVAASSGLGRRERS